MAHHHHQQQQQQHHQFQEEEAPAEEVLEYAKYIGIMEDEKELLWIAHKGINEPLPDGWEEIQSDQGVYYHSASLGETTWDHPMDIWYKRLVVEVRQQNAIQGMLRDLMRNVAAMHWRSKAQVDFIKKHIPSFKYEADDSTTWVASVNHAANDIARDMKRGLKFVNDPDNIDMGNAFPAPPTGQMFQQRPVSSHGTTNNNNNNNNNNNSTLNNTRAMDNTASTFTSDVNLSNSLNVPPPSIEQVLRRYNIRDPATRQKKVAAHDVEQNYAKLVITTANGGVPMRPVSRDRANGNFQKQQQQQSPQQQ